MLHRSDGLTQPCKAEADNVIMLTLLRMQVVDNSSAFRMTEGVPLVIPEVNPDAMAHIKLGSGKGAIIANPNCSTIIALMAVTPLHRYASGSTMPDFLESMNASMVCTYGMSCVCGAGVKQNSQDKEGNSATRS